MHTASSGDKIAYKNLSFIWFLTCYAVLPTFLVVRDLIWGMTCLQPSSDGLLAEGFPDFSSAVRQTPEDLCTASSIISLPPLSLAEKHDWRDTRGKWPLARNPEKSWWHRYISIRLFWPQPMASCKSKKLNFKFILTTHIYLSLSLSLSLSLRATFFVVIECIYCEAL